MAYNYYQPMGYQPVNYQQYQPAPQMQQPQMQNGIIWVNDYNEAAIYPVAPNSAVALWDKNSASIYLKKSDMTGKPSVTIYDLVERKEAPARTEAHYATQEALDGVSRAVEELRARFEEMRLKSHSTALNEEVVNNG